MAAVFKQYRLGGRVVFRRSFAPFFPLKQKMHSSALPKAMPVVSNKMYNDIFFQTKANFSSEVDPPVSLTSTLTFPILDNNEREMTPDVFFGKVVLVVNTASLCGLTPQLGELQILWEKYRSDRLVVLAIPCNDFGQQEPWSEKEIEEFYINKYKVDFPVAGKQAVLSPDERHEFYEELAYTWGENVLPTWNFAKFLIGRDGELAGMWSPETSPLDDTVVKGIEAALSKV
jgi:glutathione peroxidase